MLGPIFQREFLTVPRRPTHYAARAAFLGLLWVLGVTAWQAAVGWHRPARLGESARFGVLLFQLYLFVQLTLLFFFSALSAAGTVSREKDRRTFILLLMTDLRDHEIVLGKLLGALLPIGLLLLASVPVLFLLLMLGGVSPEQVVQGVIVLASTALAAGSLGGLVALWRERTFQSLALSVLFLVLYLCAVRALGVLPTFGMVNWPAVQDRLDPFLALQSVLEPGPAGSRGLAAPAYAYGLAMLGWVALLNAIGVWKLRVWNPSGEPIMQREVPDEADDEKDRAGAHAAPGARRQVWANPVLWREAATLAYGRRPLLVKLVYFLVLGLVSYFALSVVLAPGAGRVDFGAAYGLVPVAVLSLLLVAAQAVTAITSERDGGALDLLLVTDLTPTEFIFGKLAGIAWNTKEFLLPPLILACIYAWLGYLATPPTAHPELGPAMNASSLAATLGGIAVSLAFAMVLGLHVALRVGNSQLAIVQTLGTVFFLSVGTLVCIYLIVINRSFEYQWASFLLFLLLGIGGFLWVLSADRPSSALTLASVACPLAMFYAVTNVLVAKPGTDESGDPLVPFLVLAAAFGFAIAAMLVPLVSEFDVALGRTRGPEE